MLTALGAASELTNVEVGGQLTILGEYYRNVEPAGEGLRWPRQLALGTASGHGSGRGNGIYSWFGWSDHGHGLSSVTQWTRLHCSR